MVRPASSSADSDLETGTGSDSNSSEDEVTPESRTFNFALVPILVEAVKDTLQWQEETPPPKKQQKYYPELKKSLPSFPLIFEI